MSKLPKRCRKVVEAYLVETLEILLRPLSLGFDLTALFVRFILFGELRQIRALRLL